MSDEYQGWSNRETWCAALWIDNVQHNYERAAFFAKKPYCDAQEKLEEMVRGYLKIDAVAPPLADALNAYVARINWRELIDYWRAS